MIFLQTTKADRGAPAEYCPSQLFRSPLYCSFCFQDKESDALDVLNSLASMPVPDAFGYTKDTQHHPGYEPSQQKTGYESQNQTGYASQHGDVMQSDSVDSIIEEVAGLPHFDPSELR